MGYDNVLHGIEINYDYRDRMADDFFSNFSEKEVSYIKILTASLLLSLIPLHSIEEERKIKYFDIIKELIKK
jgi:hypothetical protein